MSDLKVIIVHDPTRFGYVVVARERHGRDIQALTVGDDGEIMRQPVSESSRFPALLRLDEDMARKFCVALQAALTDRGIQPDEAVKNQGKLDAMSGHLSDMRTIVGKQLGVKL